MGNKKSSENFSNTDNRDKGDWETKYNNKKARVFQAFEAAYLFALLVSAVFAIVFSYLDGFTSWLHIPDSKAVVFNRMIVCVSSGLLGGTANNIKWFYHCVARGYWHVDRRYWRIFTPFVSLIMAFVISCIFSDTMIVNGSGFTAVTVGFLAGYFSDEAAGKMAEVAQVLFNTKTNIEAKNSENTDERDTSNSQE